MEHNKNKIIAFYKREGRMPTYAELMAIYGFKSKNSVFKLVKKLAEENFIQKDDSGRLLPGKLFREIRILGLVEAGFPSAAEEELTDTLSLDDYLVKNREATFMLRVKGESMKDAGIIDGDMVLVERNTAPKDGEIVIAEVDGEWTIKYLRSRNKKPYLEPANKKFHAIHPERELKIAAVVKAVVRKY